MKERTKESLTRRSLVAAALAGSTMAGSTMAAAASRSKTSSTSGKIWSNEYWAHKPGPDGADVKLYMFRKRVGAPKPGEAPLPVLMLVHGSRTPRVRASISPRPARENTP